MEDNKTPDTSAIDMLPLGIAYLVPSAAEKNDRAKDYLFCRVNPAFEKLTGFDGSQICGKLVSEVFGDSNRCGFDWLSFISDSVRLNTPLEAICRTDRFNRLLHVTCAPTEDKKLILIAGEPNASHRYFNDINQDSSAKEPTFSDSDLEKRLYSIFNGQIAAIVIADPKTGKIIDANFKAREFFGYSEEEFKELSIYSIIALPMEETKKHIISAANGSKRYSVIPHRLKDGSVRLSDVYSFVISGGNKQIVYSVIFDAAAREKYFSKLINEKELLYSTLKSIGDGVITTDIHGVITGLNPQSEEITGWNFSEASGMPVEKILRFKDEESGKEIENPVIKALSHKKIVKLNCNTELITRLGGTVPVAGSAAPIITSDGRAAGVVMTLRNTSGEKEQSQQIRFLSYHDPLTGLYNRRYLYESIHKIDCPENLPLAFVMGDVNGLKITNDVFGHEYGDLLLKRSAAILAANCRKDDFIVRWGGDEFVVFMPRTELSQAEDFIARIKNSNILMKENGLQISISLGCAIKRIPEEKIENIMHEAEERMYHQKLMEGKNYRNTIIKTLISRLYEKSIETEAHSKRMRTYCHLIGERLNLSSKEMDELSMLAILHDIGNVAINPMILKTPGKLTPSQLEEVRRHPEIGYRIVQATPELATIAEFVLSHHERWDGTGYPRGLKKRDIPLISRILAVADAYDAMTSTRVYRTPVSREAAIDDIKRNSGYQFDPEIAEIFVDILNNDISAIRLVSNLK